MTRRLRSRFRRPRPRLFVAAVAAVAVVSGMFAFTRIGQHPTTPPLPDPETYSSSTWQKVLGGDTAPTPATWATLNDPASSDLPHADALALSDLARRVAQVDLTAQGRAEFPQLWPPDVPGFPAQPRCSAVTLLAANPQRLPTTAKGSYAKVLVAWTGTCRDTDPDASRTPQVTYVYAHRTADHWTPLRPWTIASLAPATRDPQAVAEPADWQLTGVGCGADAKSNTARVEVAAAFAQMCKAAGAEGVRLTVTSGYRSRAEQAELFVSAVKHYGSVAAARRWVAYADSTVCTSKHCAGTGVDVDPSPQILAWLGKTVGCDDAGKVVAATSCPAGTTPVPQSARFGFVAPAPQVPGYLEFVAPLGTAAHAPADCAPSGADVPHMVASIFRCRLARAGVRTDLIEPVVAQALVVSRAESNWNAAARAYAGRFATSANPADGKRYTQAGVFMISAELADAGWVPGGSAALTDPVANINGAASLWLATRGFEQFGCATGGRGGFETGPVLPAFGGPQLPTWAAQY